MKAKKLCRPVFKRDVLCRKHKKLRDALIDNFLKIYNNYDKKK